jgi:pimeloyl-ACP methyl ester carboxylesterase
VAHVLLLHGNVSSSLFFRPMLDDLPAHWHVVAPDLRGYGESEAQPIDSTLGVSGWSQDLWLFLDAIGWHDQAVHVLGWSMGGGIAMQMAIEAAARLASLTLIAPLAPYGYGGTIDAEGTPAFPDHAGSGGGMANRAFVDLLAAGERGADNPNTPRAVMLKFYVNPGFHPAPAIEEEWVTAMLSTRTGDEYYPGTTVPSPNWPGAAPGTRGILNALSAKYINLSGLVAIQPKPPILWIRGAHDAIVADRALLDIATLGAIGVVPGWPGATIMPPQPMVRQTRAVFDAYAVKGGRYREVVFSHSGHSPHLEEPTRFYEEFVPFIEAAQKKIVSG